MRLGVLGRLPRSDWPLLLLVACILLFYVAYTLAYVMLGPYHGLEFGRGLDGWLVSDSLQSNFFVDDVMVQIGELSFEEYESNKLSVPFGEFEPGDSANIILLDGEERLLKMPQPSLADRIRRLLATLWFFPFWSAGTAVEA